MSRIASAAGILLIGFTLSRLIGFLREIVLTAQFGATAEYDLFIAAFRIPDVVFTLVAGGALGSTLVPVFTERREQGDGRTAAKLAGTVFNLIALVATGAALAGIAAAPALAALLGPGFAPAEQERLTLLIRILLVQPVLLGVSEVVTRYLNVTGHFLAPAFAPAVYNVPIIVAALVFGRSLGSAGLALGVVAGALAYLLIQLPAGFQRGLRFVPSLNLTDPALARIGRLMIPRMVGQGAVQFSFIATTRLASQQPEGSLVALNLAWVLTMLPLGIFGMAVGSAALPTLSEQAARGDLDAVGHTARRTLGAIMLMVIPAALFLIGLGFPLIWIIFGRGEFTSEDAARSAQALALYAAGLPAHGALEILTRTFYAFQDTRTPVSIGVAAMALNVGLAYALVGPLGFLAIPLGLSVATMVEAVIMWLILRRHVPGIRSPLIFLPDPAAGFALIRARLGR